MKSVVTTLLLLLAITFTNAQNSSVLAPIDVFDIEYASDPQISPNGGNVIYVRNFKDIMTDKNRSNLWMIDAGGGNHRPLTTGCLLYTSPSPRDKRQSRMPSSA